VDTEGAYDFATVEIDTSGAGDVVEIIAYDGLVAGNQILALAPGVHLPTVTGGDVQIRFCFSADGAWSDQDGLYPTACGAFAVDDISVSGGGLSISAAPNASLSTDFEANDGGWVLLPAEAGAGGEWSDIVRLSDLPPPLTPCACDLTDSVLVLVDQIANGHGLFQDNLAGSPWIDLDDAGLTGTPGSILQINIYAELPLLNYIFVQFNVKYFPQKCSATGLLIESAWTSNGFVYYFGGVPQCTAPTALRGLQLDFSPFIPPGAQEIRMALGVISFCRFFANCSGTTNSTPHFDDVRFGAYGDPAAPILATRSLNIPMDAFPENGTLLINSPGRFDTNIVRGAASPEIGTSLGDTLVVLGGGNGPSGEGSEVYVEFQIFPGPGVNAGALTALYARVSAGLNTGDGTGWYSARMDTAEINGAGATGDKWMAAYHEADPNFDWFGGATGTDTDKDAGDLDPNGGVTRLANDIFPDDLFTPGTRVHIRHRTNYDTVAPTEANSFWAPPLNQPPLEYEVLPSSMTPIAGGGEWNCVLYVNHFGPRGAAPIIETALTGLLGVGSANHDQYNWDRWDVQAPSSQQASYGRPLNTEYGANVVQTLGYNCIIWNSGNLSAFTLVKEDADILIPYLTLVDFDAIAPKQLYLSGDGLVRSIATEAASEPSAIAMMNDLLGVGFNCDTFHQAGCPVGSPLDVVACVEVDPLGGADVASGVRAFQHTGQGNGCPTRRSFDILTLTAPDFGTSKGDEEYDGAAKTEAYASVSQEATSSGTLNFNSVVDGLSVHYRRDGNTTTCTFNDARDAVAERLDEVLTYLNHGGGGSLCEQVGLLIGVPGDGARGQRFRTTLSNFAPNPLLAGKTGRISFTMAREGHARVDVFDVNGRLVKSLFDGIAKEGPNDVFWNGTDETSRQVASGVYFYRLNANLQDFSKKMVVVRQGGQ